MKISKLTKSLFAISLIAMTSFAGANEALIRKNLIERNPGMPKIESIIETPIAGIFEVQVTGSDLFYSTATGDFVIQGTLIDTKLKKNITKERMDKLSAFKFNEMKTEDAITFIKGNGKRHIAIFEDPNCSYCKRLEKGFQNLKDITINVYLYPVLGSDSVQKSKNIWCSPDKAKAWTNYMISGIEAPVAASTCDISAITRNSDFGKKVKINGTPAIIFTDGTRAPGAITVEELEKKLAEIK